MTVYGADCSNYDWARGPMDLAAMRRAGISLFTHKVSEGLHSYRDLYSAEAQRRGMAAGFPVLGGYHVLHPADMGSITAQADWYLECLYSDNPNWYSHPCFIHQIDAEKFSYMTRAPNVYEVNMFGDRIVAKTGCDPKRVIAYAPRWLYGDAMTGLQYRLWASAYVTASGPFKAIYPGDITGGWSPYSGLTPVALQYSSSAVIGSQPGCDANAVRVNSEAELQALFNATGGLSVSDVQTILAAIAAFQKLTETRYQDLVQKIGEPNHATTPSVLNAVNARPTLDQLRTELAGIAPSLSDAQVATIVAELAALVPVPAFDIHSTVTAAAPADPATPA